MRLSDDLAARRRLYAFPTTMAPALFAIDIPAHYSGAGLLMGRYYPVIAETVEEVAEFERFLHAERPAPVPPDLLDLRPSNRSAGTIAFFEYRPPETGWPWLLLCHWPGDYARHADRRSRLNGTRHALNQGRRSDALVRDPAHGTIA